jgi:hypothetical protein
MKTIIVIKRDNSKEAFSLKKNHQSCSRGRSDGKTVPFSGKKHFFLDKKLTLEKYYYFADQEQGS